MLKLITAWSSNDLADWLGSWFSKGSTDPFATEQVVIPTPGMERYLTRRWAGQLGANPERADGVCAGIDFLSPSELVAKVAGEAGGQDDPWSPANLPWHCLAAIDVLLEDTEDWSKGLRTYLKAEHRDARRLALAGQTADLFINYSLQRPQLVQDWTSGRAAGAPSTHHWQYEVFQQVLMTTKQEPWPVRLRAALPSALGRIDGFPERFAVFGVGRFGQLELQCLQTLAKDREVALLMVAHAADSTTNSRLVAAFAGEETQTVKTLTKLKTDRHRLDAHNPPPSGLLGRLQSAIEQDEDLAFNDATAQTQDNSLTVHGCSGALRQVEALRDQLLHLLENDTNLQPRDVLVMCTDLDRYAPLIAQVLGTESSPVPGPTEGFRVRIADRVLRANNPVLQVVTSFTELLMTRITATEVLEFLTLPAVAEHLNLGLSDQVRLEFLVRSAGVRWGLGPTHRAAFDVPLESAHTWQAGLDRLAMGLAVDGRETELVGDVAPMEAARDDDQHLIATLISVIDLLNEAVTFAQVTHPARDWATQITQWLEGSEDPEGERRLKGLVDSESSEALRYLTAALESISAVLDADNPISLREVVGLLMDELSRYAPQPDLQTGGVAVAAMRPMRNIPFKVICLVGMDDDAFPRSTRLDGNDILAIDAKPGERDPRSEDRQLFLDALCAAEKHVVITYSSRNEVTGATLPPATPLAELLDELGDIVQEHPLSPFDKQNFPSQSAKSSASPSFSFDAAAAAVASQPTNTHPRLRDLRLPPDRQNTTLDELLAFWKNPSKVFLRNLRLPVEDNEDPADDELSLTLSGLAKWSVGNELLTAHRRPESYDVDLARGTLPVQDSRETWDEVATIVQALKASAAKYQFDDVTQIAVDVPLHRPESDQPAPRLTGILPVTAAKALVDVSFSGLKMEHELSMRIRIAALAAMGTPVTGVLVRKKRSAALAETKTIAPPNSSQEAVSWLQALAELRWRGLAQPLPFSNETSHAYFKSGPDEADAFAAAAKKWAPGFGMVPGEGEKRETLLLWDGDLSTMCQDPPWSTLPDSQDHPSLFAQLASFIFDEEK